MMKQINDAIAQLYDAFTGDSGTTFYGSNFAGSNFAGSNYGKIYAIRGLDSVEDHQHTFRRIRLLETHKPKGENDGYISETKFNEFPKNMVFTHSKDIIREQSHLGIGSQIVKTNHSLDEVINMFEEHGAEFKERE